MLYHIPPPVFRYDVADMNDLYKKTEKWYSDGPLPTFDLKNVIAGDDALEELPDLIRRSGSVKDILLVMDEVDMLRDGADLKETAVRMLDIEGYSLHVVKLAGDEYGLVHPDFEQVSKVRALLSPETIVVSLGSGVVTDITKHACFLYQEETGIKLDYIAVMTAFSVPAYTSNSAIISKDGVKRSWHSRMPDYIIMDLKIIRDTPYRYTLGGIGDTTPVFSAFADWYLAELMGYEKIVDGAWRVYDDIRELFVPYMDEVAEMSPTGLEVLGKCISNVGLSMSYAQVTTSASGYEHVMSHMLDMSAEYDHRKVGIHGQQIGVAMLLTLLHFEKLMERLDQVYSGELKIDIDDCFPEEAACKKLVYDTFSPFGEGQPKECWNDYEQKLRTWYQAKPRLRDFLANWPEHRAAMKYFLPYSAADCAKALRKVQHPMRFEDLSEPITEERGKWAMKHANLMRKRFTSADLAFFLGWLDDQWIDEIFDELYRL